MDSSTLANGTAPTFRIFISSPGDVAMEREKAKDVVRQLNAWYGPSATLVPVLWEELPLTVDMPFQDQIDVVARNVDIAVFIVWSKIGTPLIVGGHSYRSGTEREFDLMLRALEASGGNRPDILFYQRKDDAGFDHRLQAEARNDAEKLQFIQQKQLAAAFVQEHFWSEEGNVRAYHSFQHPVDFAGRLKVHLRGLIDQRLDLAGVSPHVIWTDMPYRGLEVFDLQHAAIFFGRELEVAELEQRLRDRHRAVLENLAERRFVATPLPASGGESGPTPGSPARPGPSDHPPGPKGEGPSLPSAFVAVVGASGSGKSSLVRAGLRAALVESNLDEAVHQWRTVVLVPGQTEGRLVDGLVRAIANTEGALPELRDAGVSLDDVEESLGRSPREAMNLVLKPAFQRAADRAGGRVQLLVAIDQFEEIFTDNRIGEAEREAFLLALEALARSGFCWVVVTMRSDFYPLAQRCPSFLRMKGESGQFDLLAPGPEALHRIITEPARLAGFKFEKRDFAHGGQILAAKILVDGQKQPDTLPLLSDLLLELYLRRKENVLTFAAYEELGGLEGALTQRAEKAFQALTPEQQAACPELLHALVTVEADSDAFAVRRRAGKETLADTSAKAALVDAFIAARLLTADGPFVTLAHEALLRKWERIASWVRENRQHLQIRTRVEQSQKRWEASGRRDDLLLNAGLDLEEGLSLLRDAPTLVAGVEYAATRNFIESSRDYHTRRGRRAKRGRTLAMAGMTVLTVCALAGGFLARQKSAEAQRGKLAAEGARADAEKLVEFMLVDLRDKLDGLGKLDLLEDVGEKLEIYFKDKPADLDGDRGLQLRAKLLNQLSEIKSAQGKFLEARALSEESVGYYRRIFQARGTTALDPDLEIAALNAYMDLVSNSWTDLSLPKQLALIDEALGLQSTVDLDSAERYTAVCSALRSKAYLLEQLGRKDERAEVFQKAVLMSVSAAHAHPDNFDVAMEEAQVGETCLMDRKLRTKDAANLRVVRSTFTSMIEPLLRMSEQSADPWNGKAQIAQFLRDHPNYELPRVQRAISMAEELVVHDPENRSWKSLYAGCFSAYSNLLTEYGYLKEGEEEIAKALRIVKELIEAAPENLEYQSQLASCHQVAAWNYHALGLRDKVAPHVAAARLFREHFVELDPSNPENLASLGFLYDRYASYPENTERLIIRNREEGLKLMRRAIELEGAGNSQNNWFIGWMMNGTINDYIRFDRLAEAEVLLAEYYGRIRPETYKSSDRGFREAKGLTSEADLRRKQGRESEVPHLLRRVAELRISDPEPRMNRETQVRDAIGALGALLGSGLEIGSDNFQFVERELEKLESEIPRLDPDNDRTIWAAISAAEVRVNLANSCFTAGRSDEGVSHIGAGMDAVLGFVDRDKQRIVTATRLWGLLNRLSDVRAKQFPVPPRSLTGALDAARKRIAGADVPPEMPWFLAEWDERLGKEALAKGEVDKSIALLRESAEARARTAEFDPENPTRLDYLLGAWSAVTSAESDAGLKAEAMVSRRKTVEASLAKLNHPKLEGKSQPATLRGTAWRNYQILDGGEFLRADDVAAVTTTLNTLAAHTATGDPNHADWIEANVLLASTFQRIAALRETAGDAAEGERLHQESIIFPLRRIAEVKAPADRERLWRQAHDRLQTYGRRSGKKPDGPFVQELLATHEPVARDHGGTGHSDRFLAECYRQVAAVAYYAGDNAAVLAAREKEVSLRERVRDQMPDQAWAERDLQAAWRDKLGPMAKTETPENLAAIFETRIVAAEQAESRFPKETGLKHETAVLLRDAGNHQKRRKLDDEAAQLWTRSLQKAEESLAMAPSAPVQETAANVLNQIGDLHLVRKETDKAVAAYRNALKYWEASANADPSHRTRHLELARCSLKLADALPQGAPDQTEARGLRERAVTLLQDWGGRSPLTPEFQAMLDKTRQRLAETAG